MRATRDDLVGERDRPVQVAQGQERRGVDPVLVVEAPCLVVPAVVGGEVGVERLGVGDIVLRGEGQRAGEDDAPGDLLGVEELEAGPALDVLVAHRFGLVPRIGMCPTPSP